jgi:hypothetical protein
MPEEDQETQRALMERVLEILLEVENLTSNERTWVQHGLTFIRSDVTPTSTQYKRYACCLFDGSQISLF